MDYQATTLFGLLTCIQLDVIRCVDTFTRPVEERPSDSILAKYVDVFTGFGCFPVEHHIVIDMNYMLIIHAPLRVSLSLQPKLKQTLEAMMKTGTIVKRDKSTDWFSSLLLVEKSNGKIRFCLDSTDLNWAIKQQYYVIPINENVIAKLHDTKIFTAINIKDAFWQIKLDNYSLRLCTFNTPFGRFSFCRLSFGIKSVSEVLQKRNRVVTFLCAHHLG